MLSQEAGITATSLSRRGVVWQKFVDNPVMLEFHVFHADGFSGTPSESEEMAPRWFDAPDIPFAEVGESNRGGE